MFVWRGMLIFASSFDAVAWLSIKFFVQSIAEPRVREVCYPRGCNDVVEQQRGPRAYAMPSW